MNKILFLTGCNGQLGKTITSKFEQNNWKVFGLDIHERSKNEKLFLYISGSVKERKSFVQLFSKAKSFVSPDSKICLVNNAGTAVFTPSEERTYEEFLLVSEVNLLGPIFGCTEFFNFSKEIKEDFYKRLDLQIMNIASVYGLISPNKSIYTDTSRTSSEIYGATKAGLIQMTKYFAARYAENGISVNCIAPGGILNRSLQGPEFIQNYSKLVPQARLCNENEVSSLLLSLVSGDFQYLTGQTIAIDGGMTSW